MDVREEVQANAYILKLPLKEATDEIVRLLLRRMTHLQDFHGRGKWGVCVPNLGEAWSNYLTPVERSLTQLFRGVLPRPHMDIGTYSFIPPHYQTYQRIDVILSGRPFDSYPVVYVLAACRPFD